MVYFEASKDVIDKMRSMREEKFMGFLILILFVILIIKFAPVIFYLCVKMPIGIMLFVTGITCCCTIILIPLGILLIKISGEIFNSI